MSSIICGFLWQCWDWGRPATYDEHDLLIFPIITAALILCGLVIGLISTQSASYNNDVTWKQTSLYKNLRENDPTWLATNYGLVPVSVTIGTTIIINYVVENRKQKDATRNFIDLLAKLHFLLAFAVPSYLFLGCGNDALCGVNGYVIVGTIVNSIVLNGGIMKLVTYKQKFLKFRHCLIAGLGYACSTICDTVANIFFVADSSTRSSVVTLALLFSIPLYLLGIVCVYSLFSLCWKVAFRTFSGTELTDDVVESLLYSLLLIVFFLATRVVSLLQPDGIENVSLYGMTVYQWLHVSFLMLLSTIPTGILNLRYNAAQIAVVKTQAEKSELEWLTKQIEREKEKVLNLLYNMVPREVAIKLSQGTRVDPGWHKWSCVFFSDVKGFTPFASSVSPLEVFAFLNVLISSLDACLSEFGRLYKVETAGDSFVVVGGIVQDGVVGGGGSVENESESESESIFEMLQFAYLAQRILSSLPFGPKGHAVPMRMGVHCGPVVAGLVGTLTPRFCLFGDTVNVSARLESSGEPGTVQCSAEVIAILQRSQHANKFDWQLRLPAVELKGKGLTETYWISARESPSLRSQRHNIAKKMLDQGINVFPQCHYYGTELGCMCGEAAAAAEAAAAEAVEVSEIDASVSTSPASALIPHRARKLFLPAIQVPPPPSLAIEWSAEDLSSIDFDVMQVSTQEEIYSCLVAIFAASVDLAAIDVDVEALKALIHNVGLQYRHVSYHCFHHAFCVTQCMTHLLQNPEVAGMFSPKETFAVLLSALVHDVGHLGTTNAQQISRKSYIAVCYGSQSPLEQLHLDITFALLSDERLNVLKNWSRAEVSMARSFITKTVLDTDMRYHSDLLSKLREFNPSPPAGLEGTASTVMAHSMTLSSFLLHAADLSNACRPPPITAQISCLLMDEFKTAAALEQNAGTAVALRVQGAVLPELTPAAAQGEIGFFSGCVRPYFQSLCLHFPSLTPLVDNIDANLHALAVICHNRAPLSQRQDNK